MGIIVQNFKSVSCSKHSHRQQALALESIQKEGVSGEDLVS
jgi:hypothetical protein